MFARLGHMPKPELKAQAGPPSESADTNNCTCHGLRMLPQTVTMHLPWLMHVGCCCRHCADTTTMPSFSPLPGDHGALGPDQGHGHEEESEQLTMFHSAETLCFVTILFHDGFGSPRHAPQANDFEQGTQSHIVMYARCQSITAYVQCWHLGMAA